MKCGVIVWILIVLLGIMFGSIPLVRSVQETGTVPTIPPGEEGTVFAILGGVTGYLVFFVVVILPLLGFLWGAHLKIKNRFDAACDATEEEHNRSNVRVL